ncbi:MAG TPA: peroxidase [Thermoanaerobaculia bacterium]|nr:peroxidase [Thermoanaerobaculia bacterium]
MTDGAIDYDIDYGDVQGTILRGYRVDMARHFVLGITDPVAAGALIGALVDGRDGVPKITTAKRWGLKPQCFVNIAFTAAGLAKLGVTPTQLKTFDAAFVRGATDSKSASTVGDTGESAPSNWIGGLANGSAVHIILSLWVDDQPQILESETVRLRKAFAGCMTELSAHDAVALPDNHVHFGYRDNIAQPTVIGAPPRKYDVPDDQPAVKTGEFLLGYMNESRGKYTVQPPQLSMNSSYAAFRILEQDVAGFEAFLTEYATKAKIDRELLAAKVCGRWRNGNPLTLKPDAPGEVLPMSQLNDFNYVNEAKPADDDTLGLRCPLGSHIRRNNPRNQPIVGAGSVLHRIVRRAMPYGPPYDPAKPDATPRGLVGYFINASLRNQFEFLSSKWNLASDFVKSAFGPNPADGNAFYNISGEDPFLGVNDPATSSFTLAGPGKDGSGNTKINGFSRTITTRGGAYVFLPSITGLRYLATLPAAASA